MVRKLVCGFPFYLQGLRDFAERYGALVVVIGLLQEFCL